MTNKIERHMTTEQLTAALRAAREAAEAADEGDDGGTANLDSPAFTLGKGVGKVAMLDEAAFKAGVDAESIASRWWKGWYFLRVATGGQGARRTRCAEAAVEALKVAGLDAAVFYQID